MRDEAIVLGLYPDFPRLQLDVNLAKPAISLPCCRSRPTPAMESCSKDMLTYCKIVNIPSTFEIYARNRARAKHRHA